MAATCLSEAVILCSVLPPAEPLCLLDLLSLLICVYVCLTHMSVFLQAFGDPWLCAHVRCGAENKMLGAPAGDWALSADASL